MGSRGSAPGCSTRRVHGLWGSRCRCRQQLQVAAGGGQPAVGRLGAAASTRAQSVSFLSPFPCSVLTCSLLLYHPTCAELRLLRWATRALIVLAPPLPARPTAPSGVVLLVSPIVSRACSQPHGSCTFVFHCSLCSALCMPTPWPLHVCLHPLCCLSGSGSLCRHSPALCRHPLSCPSGTGSLRRRSPALAAPLPPFVPSFPDFPLVPLAHPAALPFAAATHPICFAPTGPHLLWH